MERGILPVGRKYPPGPPTGLFGLKHLLAIRRDFVGFGAHLRRDYGDVVYFRLGPYPCYMLFHPDHLQEVLIHKNKKFGKSKRISKVFARFEGKGLVVSDGEVWTRQRRLLQPAFQPLRLQTYAAKITQMAGEMFQRWASQPEININAGMRRLAMRVIAMSLFSTDVDHVLDELEEAVFAIHQWVIEQMKAMVMWPRWLPLIFHARIRRAIAFLDQLVWGLIRERRASGIRKDDLLTWLLDAVDTEGDGKGMSDELVRDEVVTLVLTGQETIAVTMGWMSWLLCCHPDVQERVSGEVRTMLGKQPPQFADVARLTSVERVLRETMRLYPPIYFFSREPTETVEVAGYQMAPGSQVFISPYLIHRDPRWFPEPDRFDPMRFTPENEERLPACAWIPFSAGPRACIGRHMAMLEGTLAMTLLLQDYKLELAPGQGEPEREWQLSLHPKGGIRLAVRKREA